MWSRHRGAGPRERGAAAVETAIVLPLILVLTFAIIDFSILLRDYVGITNIVRDASRTASTLPRFGTVPGHAGTDGESSFAREATLVLETTGTAIPTASIDEMWVYIANARGFPLSSGTPINNWDLDSNESFSTCPPETCVRYGWRDDPDPAIPGSFQFISGTLDPLGINACPGDDNAMAVGVYMQINHSAPVGLFGTSGPLSDRAVTKFEPLRRGEGSCKP